MSLDHRINSDIKALTVRLLDADGTMKGIIKRAEAQHLAEEEGLDLVEIQPNGDPPVCRIMDYGKFRYENQKKLQAAKKQQKQVEEKEVQFRPVIDDHDYQTKMNHVKGFLDEGHKVRLVVRMKGRERMNAELGQRMTMRLMEDLKEVATFEDRPRRTPDGQQILFAQSSKKLAKKPKGP